MADRNYDLSGTVLKVVKVSGIRLHAETLHVLAQFFIRCLMPFIDDYDFTAK
jgi:hypothetical protein